MWVGQSWDAFEAKWKEPSGDDRRLVDLEVHTVNGKQRYGRRAGSGGYFLWVGQKWGSFQDE